METQIVSQDLSLKFTAVPESAAATLEKNLHSDIPIASAMGVRVVDVSTAHVTLAAPLDANVNKASSAFGGSVYSVAVLSCWSLVSESLAAWGFKVDYVVVQDGHMDYTIPVTGDFEAQASWASEREAEKFRNMLKRKGLARAHLIATVRSGGRDCATMEARFAARVTV